jgi:hypothetical protein
MWSAGERQMSRASVRSSRATVFALVWSEAFTGVHRRARGVLEGDPHRSQTAAHVPRPRNWSSDGVYAHAVRKRWFSRRAFLLHIEFFLLASACLVAGWWQVTRALTGNGLSWVYSAEWPGFAVLAILAWWHLIHEDPEAYRARKQRPPEWDDD